MSQTTGGVRAILAKPSMYLLFKRLMVARADGEAWVSQYVRASPGDRVLDIGCGPGDMVARLPPVQYTGFDMSAKYIESAQRNYGDRAKFVCGRVDEMSTEQDAFDLVLAVGVLHHLDDAEAVTLCRIAHRALRPGGRLFLFDPVFTPDQSRIARFIVSMDRGRNVRTEAGYRALISQAFDDVTCHIRHDLLRVPYTHIIFDCLKR